MGIAEFQVAARGIGGLWLNPVTGVVSDSLGYRHNGATVSYIVLDERNKPKVREWEIPAAPRLIQHLMSIGQRGA